MGTGVGSLDGTAVGCGIGIGVMVGCDDGCRLGIMEGIAVGTIEGFTGDERIPASTRFEIVFICDVAAVSVYSMAAPASRSEDTCPSN